LSPIGLACAVRGPVLDRQRRRLADFQTAPELGVHGGEMNDVHQLYFMCDDLDAEMARLADASVTCSDPFTASWGRATGIPLPGGGKIGLYEALHERP
jgi:hypothetical protein